MIRIIKGHVLIYLYLFIILTSNLDNVIPVYFNILFITISYIYIGYNVKELDFKKWNYFILSFIGLIVFISAFIVSPYDLANKNIDSSYVWYLLDLYLAPFEFIRHLLNIKSLLYATYSLKIIIYLIEIFLLGFLPILGSLIRRTRIK